jgi:hypothetical protein
VPHRLAHGLRTLAVVAALALLDPPDCRAQAPAAGSVAIPDSPAGRVLKAWLEAFDSGDPNQLDAYYKKHEPDKSAENEMPFREQTGGFDLVGIQTMEPLHLVFLVKERRSEARARGRLDVAPGTGGAVTTFSLVGLPKGATLADFVIDGTTRRRVVDSAVADLIEFYVNPDVAKQMEQAVRAQEQRGAYDHVTDGFTFADTLTADFRAVSHDRHLFVTFSPARIPDQPPGDDPQTDQENRKRMEAVNCGFDRVERLPGNIGYLKFGFFGNPEVCGPTAIAAMNLLAHVDALIIDLRQNGGGWPPMVALVATYLFDEPTHLNDIWERKTDKTEQYWTLPYVPGPRLAKTPVFVLTSKQTFSGAEEFTYDLKNLKRATIVGETTGGGAHPVSGHRIDDHFAIGVPFGRPINPVSKTDWEGTGVEPDVKVPAADALATAEKLAGDAVAAAHKLAGDSVAAN